MDFNYDKDTWEIIDTFFKYDQYYLTKHHLDSYNDFIINKIPQTIQQYNPQRLYKELDKSTNKFKYETHIYYGGKEGDKIYLGHPIIVKDTMKKNMYPNEARLRNLTYASHIFCDIHIEYFIRNGEDEIKTIKTFNKVNIGKIPIMLHSKLCVLNGLPFDLRKNMGECPYDQGGYFIIDGQEKVIVSHERKAENKLYIVKSQEGLYSYSAQIKSVPNNTFKYARTTVVNINKNTEEITVRLPSIKTPIPLFILFRALGIESDKEILTYILYNLESDKSKLFMEFLRPSIEHIGPIYSEQLAIKYLSSLTQGNSISHLMDIIKTDVFPHMGDNVTNKAYYLGYVVNKLISVYYNIEPLTDRDSFVYKRVDLSGFLLAALFRENFKQFQRDSKIAIDSEYRFNSSQYQDNDYVNIINNENLKKIFNHNVIETAIMKSFKIGTILNKKGLIQSLNRISNIGAISQLRRINTYGDNIMIGQRKLHPTQYGIICPVETPDGGNIGIKKHLTITGHITFGCDPNPIIKLLNHLGLINLENTCPPLLFNKTKIFINGKWIGIHENPRDLYKILRLFRRNALINIFTSLNWDIKNMEINILTDGGRCCKPLYIMEENKLLVGRKHLDLVRNEKISWINLVGGFLKKSISYYDCEFESPENINLLDYQDIISKLTKTSSVIEFIDTDEMNGIMLCSNINNVNNNGSITSHCEIHASLIMGILGFTIPYVNTSQAPRNVYGTGQTKQSVGVYISNYRNRFDISAHVLYYPQKPLITTRLSKYGFIDKLPTGINAIVAICSYSGYNQDDSVMINKSSLERGLFNSCYFKTYDDKEVSDTRNNIEEFFYNPNDESSSDIKKNNSYDYNKVNKNGRIVEGDYITDNDIIISKYTQIGSGSGASKIDASIAIKQDGYGVVDKVFSDYYNTNKQQHTRVRICTTRMPTLGDKFASRHGQKGVIGMILSQEDMPYSKDGIVPDIIINPHAIPSRMTLGQLVECVTGKSASINGFIADATPFTNIDNNEIFKLLEKNNYSKHGDEILYSGISGKQLKTKIFIGPTYYQRLKHMVKDKINSRAEGSMTLKNRQPPAGRAVGGGLRIGEMERDAILSHGTLQFLKETMYDRSDAYETYISANSGMTSVVNKYKNVRICPSTDGPLEFTEENNNETMVLKNKNSSCDIVKVKIPYNTNLMIQECNAMGIAMRLIVNDNSEYNKIELPNTETKFELQDSDKRNIIIKKSTKTKTKKIPKNHFNNVKLIDNMNNNKIIVKNLPSGITKDDILKLFETIGNIYDLHLNNLTKECLIIYPKQLFAQQAVNQLNNSLLDNSRINIEIYNGSVYDFKSYHSEYKSIDYDNESINEADNDITKEMTEIEQLFIEENLDKLIEDKYEDHKKSKQLEYPYPPVDSDESPDYSVSAYEKKYGKLESMNDNESELGPRTPSDTPPDSEPILQKGGGISEEFKNIPISTSNNNNFEITKLPQTSPPEIIINNQNSMDGVGDITDSQPLPINIPELMDTNQNNQIKNITISTPPSSTNPELLSDIDLNLNNETNLDQMSNNPTHLNNTIIPTDISEISNMDQQPIELTHDSMKSLDSMNVVNLNEPITIQPNNQSIIDNLSVDLNLDDIQLNEVNL